MVKSNKKPTYDGSDEQFEITDHTQASPWETLISEVENIIQKILVDRKSSTDNTIVYNTRSYQLIYISPNESTQPVKANVKSKKVQRSKISQLKYNNFMNPKNDFQFKIEQQNKNSIGYQIENFSNWFGIHEYFLLLSLRDNGPNLSDLSILMSALSIALHNNHCFLPAFVGFDEKRYENFLGYMFVPISLQSKELKNEYFNVKLATELISQSSLTSNQNISESIEKQLKIFYSKISVDPDDRNWDQFLSLSTTSTKYTYIKGHWDEDDWRSSSLNFTNNDNANEQSQQYQLQLKWGFPIDPIHEMQLCVMCPPLKTTHILDGNDFSSMPTPKTWFTKATYRRSHSSLYQLTLGVQSLFNYFIDSFKSLSIQEIVSYYGNKNGNKQPQQQQQQQQSDQFITSSQDPSLIKTMGTFGKNLASSLVSPNIPTDREIDLILRDIFFDGKDTSDIYHFNNIPEDDLNSPPPIENSKSSQKTTIKRAPIDSLFYSFCTISLSIQSLIGIIMVWNELIKEIQWHWENLKLIPKTFSSSDMNANNCLIYQKLQMINYCIKRKLEYNDQQYQYQKSIQNNKNNNNNNNTIKKAEDNGWEFDELSELDNNNNNNTNNKSDNNYNGSDINNGVLKGKYLMYEDREIVIPITQDNGPMTDDMVSEHLNQLMEIGEDSPEKRLELQTPSLLSDMQAFKNANPGCIFEDFIRWHSNGDWITNPVEIQNIQERQKQQKNQQQQQNNNNKKSSKKTITTIDVDNDIEEISEESEDEEDQQDEDDKMKIDEEDLVFINNDSEDDESNGRVVKQGYGRDGCLSIRMSSSNGLWRRVWRSAQPIHTFNQTPLFDFNKQAESALQFLSNISPDDLMYQILSVILISIASIFSNEKSKSNLSIEYCLGVDFEPIKQIVEKYYDAVNTTWFSTLPSVNIDKIKSQQFEPIFQSLQDIEFNYSKYTSLKTKFNKLDRVISNLYVSGYSDILENEFSIVSDLFFGDREDFYPDSNDIEYDITNSFQPNIKEYITRSYLPRPFKNSQILPHKMYTSISPYECRIATAISEEDI